MDCSVRDDQIPFVCDLDGTLTRTDTTYELLILFLKHNPLTGWLTVLGWLRDGKAQMKTGLAAAVGDQLDVTRLPYASALFESFPYRDAPRRALVSGAARPVVDAVADRIGGFETVVGTENGRNLTSMAKAAHLIEVYPDGFDYVGNSSDDIAVWENARRSYVINAPASVIAAARARGITLDVIEPRASQARPLYTAMRLHQWVKNSLLFTVPALNVSTLTPSVLAVLVAIFVAFGLIASATYLLNDLLDIQEDRRHHSKSDRPFSAGTLDIKTGIAAIVVFFACGMAIAMIAHPPIAGLLAIYAAMSLSYSLYLKRVVILDAMTLAFLFCWRIFIGGVALSEETNVWFMTAVGAFFLSLAFGKRCIELVRKSDAADADPLHGRGYIARDYPVLLGLGLVTGMIAPLIVLIYVYLSESSIVNNNLSALSLAALLCFWIGRFWVLVNRGAVQDDPIIFALEDRVSRWLLLMIGAVLLVEQIN
jgi:4-hydroxybenzoate polyprenyltransferase